MDDGEDVGSQINYSVTSEPGSSFRDFEDEDITKDIELPSGRKAHIISAADRDEEEIYDNQNEIYLEEKDLHIKIHGYNVERPLDTEDADELIQIIDSVHVD